MGNKPATQEGKKVIVYRGVIVKTPPPVDRAYVRWLAKDLERIHRYVPDDSITPTTEPPEHYIEYMRLYGWLDLDLNDPDLAHLFK